MCAIILAALYEIFFIFIDTSKILKAQNQETDWQELLS